VEEAMTTKYEPINVTPAMLERYASRLTGRPAKFRWFTQQQILEAKQPKAKAAGAVESGGTSWLIAANLSTEAASQRQVLLTLAVGLVHERDKCTCNGGGCPAWRREERTLRKERS
jgi:hypothetical protein